MSARAIAGRMRDVNTDLGISKRGAPNASELKPKTKDPILKKEKVDLDKLAEDFLIRNGVEVKTNMIKMGVGQQKVQ